MNVQNVNSQAINTGVSNPVKEQESMLSLGKKGDEIEGIITQVTDQISINFNGKEVKIPKSSVEGATEGSKKRFKIMDISATSVKLKEVGVGKESTKAIQAYCTKVEADQASFAKRLEEASSEKTEESDENLDDSANRMTADDSESLDEEGYDYKKFELERLEKALTRVKEQRAQKEESIGRQIENNKQFVEDVKKIAIHVLKSSPYAEQIINKLEDSNLPITEANIKNILNAMNQSESIKNLSDASISYMIDNELDITLGNIYKAGYSAFAKSTNAISDKDFEAISKQVHEVIKNAGLEVNKESQDQARWILNNELPLTVKTLKDLNSLQQLRNNYNPEDILNEVVSTLEHGKEIEDTPLVKDNDISLSQVINDIDSISDEAIERVVKKKNNNDITIKDLKEQQKVIYREQSQKNAENVAQTEMASTHLVSQSEEAAATQVDIQAVKTRRQLEEIRLKMTEDAVAKITSKGIKIDTTGIERVVEELRKIEDDYYRQLLQETGTDQTEENLAILKDTTSKVNSLRWMPSNLLADTFEQRQDATINTLHEAGAKSQAKFVAANESYEALMTAPRQDMGDSIQKAFKNSMTNILKELSLEDTRENQRAIRILGYNGLTITKESVEMMKEYDQKVNYLLKNLTPSVTMDLIKQNKNPVDIPIDELNQEIAKCKEVNGISDEEGYARYLWKLEKQDGITQEQRAAYIGIYRLLHNVEKTDGAAIGSLARTGKEITLGNLLGEVRTKRAGRIDKNIDDSFGMLSQVTYKSSSITDQIQQGFHAENSSEEASSKKNDSLEATTQYNQMLLKDILDHVTPSQLQAIQKEHDITKVSLEKLKELLDQTKENEAVKSDYYNNQVNQLRELAKNSNEAIQLLTNNNMPVSIDHILSANVLLNASTKMYGKLLEYANSDNKENTSSSKELESAIDKIADAVEQDDTLMDSINQFAQVANDIIDTQVSKTDISSEQINNLDILRGAIRLSTNLSRNEHYEIPIQVGENVTNISLTVVNRPNQQDSKITMSVQSEQYGKIEAEFSFSNRNSKVLILCEDEKTSNAIKESVADIEQDMKKQNMNIVQLDIGVENITKHSYVSRGTKPSTDAKNNVENTTDNNMKKATTKELYQVAKSFVILIKRLEENNRK